MLLGAEVITEPAAVVRHCYVRDIAMRYATPRADYIPAYHLRQ